MEYGIFLLYQVHDLPCESFYSVRESHAGIVIIIMRICVCQWI